MKKACLLLLLVTLLAGTSLALELGGKTGVGLRATSLSVRGFVNNNFGLDLSVFYSNSTQSGQADSNIDNLALGLFYVREVYPNTLLEIGTTVQDNQGSSAGVSFDRVAFNPFVGGEVFINDHVALDGKVFFATYLSQMSAGSRTTWLYFLNSNLGVHIYF
ncbi:MAG: hypothetical protein WC632_05035 [Candidatus Margulisiibacteriota bacterium]